MTTQEPVRPVVLVGFVGVALIGFAPIQPPDSLIFVEEPDVIRKRDVQPKTDNSPLVRDLIPWEFHLPGKADEFYHAHRDLNPAAVISLSEYGTAFAARLAERYGLPGATFGAAQILRDKALLRRVSRSAGIRNPESATVESAADVLAFLRANTGPIVLKPANRQASVGTQVIHDPAEVQSAWANCVVQDEGVFVPDRQMELRMLAESYVRGTEYSVEMLVRDGENLFANVTAKQLYPGPRPVEMAHIVPADITPELTALLGEQTLEVVRAIGFQYGIVHCEWIVADGLPYLVECAGRLAGDGIIELIENAYPVELKRHYVEVMKGEPLSAELPTHAKGGAATRFLAIEPGIVADVRGVEDAEQAEGMMWCDVSIEPGDRFGGLRSSWDRVGDVTVVGGSPAEALRRAEAAAAMIQIDMVAEPADAVSYAGTAD
jgi:biotin carboxylase